LSGFDEDEVRDLLKSLEAREKGERPESFDLDHALDEARRTPRSRSGDLWQLGEHRLLCGDATKPDDVARLFGDAQPTLLTTDPPYGVSLDPTWRDGVYNALGPCWVVRRADSKAKFVGPRDQATVCRAPSPKPARVRTLEKAGEIDLAARLATAWSRSRRGHGSRLDTATDVHLTRAARTLRCCGPGSRPQRGGRTRCLRSD